MELTIYQVDAFTSKLFAGNPAAVCPLDDWLPDDVLQSIAVENNLSETAFFVKRGDDFDLRWFTPGMEVDLCGHATLASAFIIATQLEPARQAVQFHTKSGLLRVTHAGDLFTLDFPARPPRPHDNAVAVLDALGVTPRDVLKADKMLAVLDNEAAVGSVTPDMAKVAALPSDGLIVSAPGDSCDFVSRYFAPHAGILEDPVTGSAHCVLTPYWSRCLGKTKLNARQISKRGGDLICEDKGERVLISGRVVPYLEGRIRV